MIQNSEKCILHDEPLPKTSARSPSHRGHHTQNLGLTANGRIGTVNTNSNELRIQHNPVATILPIHPRRIHSLASYRMQMISKQTFEKVALQVSQSIDAISALIQENHSTCYLSCVFINIGR